MYNFKSVIGNEHIVNALQGTIEQGRVNHAICITGKAGTGRKLISRAFAKALQCEAQQDTMQIAMMDTAQSTDSCGVCASCVSFEGGTHPDIFQIRPEKSSIGVDVVREQIVAEIAHRPHRYPYKVFIIEESQTLTVQAQNALLKTLEEPSGYGVFILAAEKTESLLPTIRSRCMTYSTRAVGVRDISEYLVREGIAGAEESTRLAQLSHGSIGRAIQLATDEEFRELRDYATQLAGNLGSKNLVECFAQTKELERYKHRIADVLDILSVCYRDELVTLETDEAARALDGGMAIQTKYSAAALIDKLAALDTARTRLRFNGNFQLVMDSLLLTLKNA